MAVDVVQGLAGGQEGIDKLAPFAATLLPALLRLMLASGPLSKAALTALINLSQARLPAHQLCLVLLAAGCRVCRCASYKITKQLNACHVRLSSGGAAPCAGCPPAQ